MNMYCNLNHSSASTQHLPLETVWDEEDKNAADIDPIFEPVLRCVSSSMYNHEDGCHSLEVGQK